jgi:broad specificity phosphatase PhoE
MGEWEGKTTSYLEQTYPNEYFSFWNSSHPYKPMKGETFRELQSRVIEALNQIKRDNTSGQVLIVTHSVVIKCLLAVFKNNPLEKSYGSHRLSMILVLL